MRTITATVYKYSELSEEAKIQALDSWVEEIMSSVESAEKELLEDDREVFDASGCILTVFDL